MKDATKRSIVRWIHIVVAIPILGYIYSPFEKLPDYARNSVCIPSCNGPLGIVDVERPSRSTAYFEETGPVICMRCRAGKYDMGIAGGRLTIGSVQSAPGFSGVYTLHSAPFVSKIRKPRKLIPHRT
jgi:hypothetical protein